MAYAIAQPHAPRLPLRRGGDTVAPGTIVVDGSPALAPEAPGQTAAGRSDEVSPSVLAAACRGEHRAFGDIMRHSDRRLRLIAFRLLRDRDLMDDALQDVAIKAFRGLPSLRHRSSVGAWLCRITYTTCLDYLRRTRPLELRPPHELPLIAGCEPDPADAVCERDQIEHCLADLTPEQRVAVLLVDQEGFDYRAAAAILGIPPGTVGSRLSLARAALRRSFAAAADRGDEA